MEQYNVRLEAEELQKMEEIKKETGVTVSWQIRQAIKDYLKNEKATN